MGKIDTRRFTLICEKCGWEIQGPAFAVLEVGKNHECGSEATMSEPTPPDIRCPICGRAEGHSLGCTYGMLR